MLMFHVDQYEVGLKKKQLVTIRRATSFWEAASDDGEETPA
jgi:hypothetical protein